jgi:hypothetical protein
MCALEVYKYLGEVARFEEVRETQLVVSGHQLDDQVVQTWTSKTGFMLVDLGWTDVSVFR